MNYKREIIKRAAYGVPIGISIGATFALVIAYIMKDQSGMPAPDEYRLHFYVISYIVSMLIGAIFGASSVIWDVEKWSLRKQTMLHFVITITSHLTCAVIANWIPFKLQALAIYGGIYFFLYVLIYIVVYSVQKKRIAQLNEALES